MHAMALTRPAAGRVDAVELDIPAPGPGQVLVRVRACGVCRTDLHVVDGELPDPVIPIVPGHEIVGTIERVGPGEQGVIGDRVGIPWLAYACGVCAYCRSGQENLCPSAKFTGYQVNGGYAEYAVADARFCFPLPASYDDQHAAPLLCAGLIGFRAYRMAGRARRLGIYGFGAAAHIIAQVALFEGREVYAFVRPGDDAAAAFARELGCEFNRKGTVRTDRYGQTCVPGVFVVGDASRDVQFAIVAAAEGAKAAVAINEQFQAEAGQRVPEE